VKRQQQLRGVALITALLITALATIVVTNLAWDNVMDRQRATVLLNRDQAIQVALGAESWVIDILRQDLQDSPTQTDHLGELWASELPGLPIEGGEVFGAIEDMQGRFNINNLVDDRGQVDQDSVDQFKNLLNALGLDPRFAGIAADWIDSDTDPLFPDGAEDSIYTGMTPPYRTGNQILTSVSELAALEGMDRATFRLLEPHISALPGRTEINVNTATAPVLQSLDEDMTAANVETLMSEREGTGFSDPAASFSALGLTIAPNRLAESTQYFRLKVVVRIGTVRITLYSLLLRGTNGVTPILRSLGTS